jgi:hypothetical protein
LSSCLSGIVVVLVVLSVGLAHWVGFEEIDHRPEPGLAAGLWSFAVLFLNWWWPILMSGFLWAFLPRAD